METTKGGLGGQAGVRGSLGNRRMSASPIKLSLSSSMPLTTAAEVQADSSSSVLQCFTHYSPIPGRSAPAMFRQSQTQESGVQMTVFSRLVVKYFNL